MIKLSKIKDYNKNLIISKMNYLKLKKKEIKKYSKMQNKNNNKKNNNNSNSNKSKLNYRLLLNNKNNKN